MLIQLSIQNVVLIEELILELAPGFSVITGETGAGKSILVHALSLVLGGRVRPEVLRAGADEASVEALFEVTPGSRAAARLAAAGIRCDGELVVRRLVQASGTGDQREVRSRAYINGRLCTAAQLSEIATDLCDIASQHESVSLTDPATHVEYLDAFAALQADREEVSREVDGLTQIVQELDALGSAERTRAEREDFLRWQLHEIDELAPQEDEETELAQELARLRHAGQLQAATRGAAEALYDAPGAMCDSLARLATDLEQAAAIDASLAPHARALQVARSELTDAARALGRYAESVETSPERLAEVEERTFRLQKLLRKHGPTTRDLKERRLTLVAELDSLSSASDRIAELETERARRFARAEAAARELSRKRHAAADTLGKAIGVQLAQLGMGRARVVVEVTAAAASADALEIDGARLSRTGIDRVEFLIAPNRGEEPRPMRRIASGGASPGRFSRSNASLLTTGPPELTSSMRSMRG